jgi:hypothetical protein
MTSTTELRIEDHAPRIRCYRCGSDTVTALCHHCGKAMCDEHRPEVLTLAKTPISTEFADLGLEAEHSGAYHCEDHEHVVKGSLKNFLRAGIAVAVAGVLLTLLSLITGLIIAAIGAGITATAFHLGRRRRDAELNARPALPVLPSPDSVNIVETLSGEIRLSDGGEYSSTPGHIEGAIEVVMTLTDADRRRPQKYRDRYDLPSTEPTEFSAGFGVIEGDAGIKLEPEPGQGCSLLPDGMGLAFAGKVNGHPLFTRGESKPAAERDDKRPAGEWSIHVPYSLQGAHPPTSMPIWLVPSLVPDTDRRTLELDVHWVTLSDDLRPGGKHHPLTLDMLELIELVVPTEWGDVESVAPDASVWNPSPDRTRKIQWKRLRVTKQERSKILTIRFAKPVKLQPGSQQDQGANQENRSRFHLRGKIQASFSGTLSGVEGFAIYRPLGYPWKRSNADGKVEQNAKTDVSVDFDLSLNSIRYQKVLVIPGSSQEDQGEKTAERPEVKEFAGVVPDYRTVIELTNRMSSNYYVKRVIENPPSVGGRANLLNRFWDIAGRYYDGVYPIDFHVTLIGEENYAGSLHAHTGSTAVRLTVQGMYVDDTVDAVGAATADPAGYAEKATMKDQIETQWDNLYNLIESTLNARARSFDAATMDQRYAEVPSAPPSDPDGNGYPADFAPEHYSQPHPVTPASADVPLRQKENRAATLRKRRDDATEALLAGRISEETYHQIIAGIDTELAGG